MSIQVLAENIKISSNLIDSRLSSEESQEDALISLVKEILSGHGFNETCCSDLIIAKYINTPSRLDRSASDIFLRCNGMPRKVDSYRIKDDFIDYLSVHYLDALEGAGDDFQEVIHQMISIDGKSAYINL